MDFDEPIVIWTRGGALHLCPECYESEPGLEPEVG